MRQHPAESIGLHVLAHSGLRAYFDSPHGPLGALRAVLDSVGFVDDRDLNAVPQGTLDQPVLIPVTSEFQAEGLRALRVRHPLSLLVAVTNDISGFRTYYAIRSGANFVLNLAIPGERQVGMLVAQLRAQPAAPALDTATPWHQAGEAPEHAGHRPRPEIPAAGETTGSQDGAAGADRCTNSPLPAAPAPEKAPPALSQRDAELLRLLCTSATVSEIARRCYCSERSMYRRIRKLYDDLGVTSRTELMSLATVLRADPPLTARAS